VGQQLNIRSDKAHALAVELAASKNMTLIEIVELALERLKALDVPTQADKKARKEAALKRIEALSHTIRAEIEARGGKLSSNHDELYDENGLPT
jgi:hypothetical protein